MYQLNQEHPGIVVLFSMPLVFCNCQEKIIHTCTLLSLYALFAQNLTKNPKCMIDREYNISMIADYT
jgi:hypothetical protein